MNGSVVIALLFFWWLCVANSIIGDFTIMAKSLIEKRLVNPGEWGVWWGGRYGWYYLVATNLVTIGMPIAIYLQFGTIDAATFH